MKQLLMITSAIALLAAPAVAQETETPVGVGDQTAEQPGLATELEADETQMDVDGDGDLETLKNGYTDAHEWVDAPVYADGAEIGEVERVHYEGQEIDAIVIESAGVAEVGGREVEIPIDEAELTTADDGEPAFTLAMTTAEIEALPDFDESKASDYPLSDNPADEDASRSDDPAEETGGNDDETN